MRLPAISLDATSSVAHLPPCGGEEAEVVVMASLVAAELDEAEKRLPVDLVVVLDKSGSMRGTPLDYCKKTLCFLINDCMGPNDSISIITFDSDANVALPCTLLDSAANKEAALEAVRSIITGSTTNLSGGIFEGLKQIEKGRGESHALLVLTDGMANCGITDAEKLVRSVANEIEASPHKPSLYTFGYGSSVDAALLTRLATESQGSFYSILSVEDVPLAFADVLGGLLSISGQAIELCLDIPEECTFVGQAMTKFPQTFSKPTRCCIALKDMHAGEKRDICVKIKVPSDAPSQLIAIQASVDYMDLVLERRVSHSSAVTLRRLTDGETPPTVSPPNVAIEKQLLRVLVAENLHKAHELANGIDGDLAAAQQVIQGSLDHITERVAALNLSLQSEPLLGELVHDLIEAKDGLSSRERWTTVGVHRSAQSMIQHTTQRSNRTPVKRSRRGHGHGGEKAEEDEDDDVHESSYRSPTDMGARLMAQAAMTFSFP